MAPECFSQAVFTLAVANITAFSTHKAWLAETAQSDDAICMVETNLRQHHQRSASSWFRTLGWEASWSHAPSTGAAGGVGLAAPRKWPVISQALDQRWLHALIPGLPCSVNLFVYYGSASQTPGSRDRDGHALLAASASVGQHHCRGHE